MVNLVENRAAPCVIDGEGLRKAVNKVFGQKAVVERCIWHERDNVMRYPATHGQTTYRRKLQAAYEKPTYAQAKTSLMKVRSELPTINESAVARLNQDFTLVGK